MAPPLSAASSLADAPPLNYFSPPPLHAPTPPPRASRCAAYRIHVHGHGVYMADLGTPGIIERCEIWGGGTAVAARRGARPRIVSNKLNNSYRHGVALEDSGTDGRLEGNEISGCSGEGILVADGAHATLVANKIHHTGTNGILLTEEGTRARMEGNEIWECDDFGLSVSHSAEADVAACKIRDNRRGGVKIFESASATLTGSLISGNLGAGVTILGNLKPYLNNSPGAHAKLVGNTIRDHAARAGIDPLFFGGRGIVLEGDTHVQLTVVEDNVFVNNEAGDVTGKWWDAVKNWREDEKEVPAIAAWWGAQQMAATAAGVASRGPLDWVLPPSDGAYDVTIAPGENVQAGVDRCPPGGSVFFLPGTHAGPLRIASKKVIRMFGGGRAILRSTTGDTIDCSDAEASLDGLILRGRVPQAAREEGSITRLSDDELYCPMSYCISAKGGDLRIQACDIRGGLRGGVRLINHAAAAIARCRYGERASAAFQIVTHREIWAACLGLHRNVCGASFLILPAPFLPS